MSEQAELLARASVALAEVRSVVTALIPIVELTYTENDGPVPQADLGSVLSAIREHPEFSRLSRELRAVLDWLSLDLEQDSDLVVVVSALNHTVLIVALARHLNMPAADLWSRMSSEFAEH